MITYWCFAIAQLDKSWSYESVTFLTLNSSKELKFNINANPTLLLLSSQSADNVVVALEVPSELLVAVADVPHDDAARPRYSNQLREGGGGDEALEESGTADEGVVRVVGDRRGPLGVDAGRVHILEAHHWVLLNGRVPSGFVTYVCLRYRFTRLRDCARHVGPRAWSHATL